MGNGEKTNEMEMKKRLESKKKYFVIFRKRIVDEDKNIE
jgi:hypothetical protein